MVNMMSSYSPGVAARIFFAALLTLAIAPAQKKQASGPEVQLTPEQRQVLRALQAQSASKAAEEMRTLTLTAKRFNANLLSPSPDTELDQQLGKELVGGFADLIQLRINRIRAAAKTFTPEQKVALAAELEKSDSVLLFDDLVQKVFGDK
jgi:hypothetical protein